MNGNLLIDPAPRARFKARIYKKEDALRAPAASCPHDGQKPCGGGAFWRREKGRGEEGALLPSLGFRLAHLADGRKGLRASPSHGTTRRGRGVKGEKVKSEGGGDGRDGKGGRGGKRRAFPRGKGAPVYGGWLRQSARSRGMATMRELLERMKLRISERTSEGSMSASMRRMAL